MNKIYFFKITQLAHFVNSNREGRAFFQKKFFKTKLNKNAKCVIIFPNVNYARVKGLKMMRRKPKIYFLK